MRKKLFHILLILLIAGFILPGVASAGEFAKVGTVGMQFTKIPVGTRGVAMGNSFGSLSDDGSSMFWNPAGMMHVRKTYVMVEQVNWLADIRYNAIGVGYKINHTFAAGVFATSLNSGDIERTTIEQPNGTGSYYQVSDMLVGLTGAMQLTDKFTFGANVKYVRENMDGEIAGTFSIDVGTMYDTRWKTIRLSMNIRNFGPEIQLGGHYYDYNNGVRLEEPTEYLEYHFPMIFKLGLAADPYKDDMHRFTVVGELEHPNDNLERYNVGGEYGFQELFFLRGGYTFNHDTMGLSAGFGAKWQGFGIDYAFTDYGILEAVHRFSINFEL